MSSKNNKRARELLEEMYGKGCMFKRARIAQKIEAMGGIKTYKKFLQEKRYTLKQIKRYESLMSYHHLKHREDGGKATIENGAEINSLAHCYLHSLPRHQEEVINNMLRDYKNSIECKVVLVDDLELPFEIITTEIIPAELEKNKKNIIELRKKVSFKEN